MSLISFGRIARVWWYSFWAWSATRMRSSAPRSSTYRDLLIILFPWRCIARTQQREQLLHVLDLSKYLRLHLRLALQLIRCWVRQLLNVVERENASLPLE